MFPPLPIIIPINPRTQSAAVVLNKAPETTLRSKPHWCWELPHKLLVTILHPDPSTSNGKKTKTKLVTETPPGGWILFTGWLWITLTPNRQKTPHLTSPAGIASLSVVLQIIPGSRAYYCQYLIITVGYSGRGSDAVGSGREQSPCPPPARAFFFFLFLFTSFGVCSPRAMASDAGCYFLRKFFFFKRAQTHLI